jgi:hypothetical protein
MANLRFRFLVVKKQRVSYVRETASIAMATPTFQHGYIGENYIGDLQKYFS